MLVKVRNIPEEGMDVEFLVADNSLRAGMRKDDELVDILKHSAECTFHLSPMNKDVYLSGGISTSLRPICSRCGEEFDYSLALDLSLTLSPNPPKEKGVKSKDSYQESDEGIVYFKNDEINLDEVVREQILLSLPMKYLCRTDCQGLCTVCGANLNDGPHSCKVPASKGQKN